MRKVTKEEYEDALLDVVSEKVAKKYAEEERELKPEFEDVEVWSNITKIKALYEALYGLKEQPGLGDDILTAFTHYINIPDTHFYKGEWKGVTDILALGPAQFYEFIENIFTGKNINDYYKKWAREIADYAFKRKDSIRMKISNNIGYLNELDKLTREPSKYQ